MRDGVKLDTNGYCIRKVMVSTSKEADRRERLYLLGIWGQLHELNSKGWISFGEVDSFVNENYRKVDSVRY